MFNLESKRMIGRQVKEAFDLNHMVERRQRHINLEMVSDQRDSSLIFFGQSILEETNIRRRIVAVRHAFIKGHMGSILDLASNFININSLLHGFAIAEEHTWTRPNINLGRGFS